MRYTAARRIWIRSNVFIIATLCFIATVVVSTRAQRGNDPAAQPSVPPVDDAIKTLVARLDLDKYKATINGLTQFGDRRQGTDRNRAAVDWIEAQLKRVGCTNTERITYDYEPPAGRGGGGGRGRGGAGTIAAGGGRPRGIRARTGVNTDPNAQPISRCAN